MQIRLLKQFLALAETLHFGRAAELCHVSPSTLSRTMRHLEEELGVTLFERDNRSVALTRAGEIFLRYARERLVQWDALRNELMAEQGELTGELSVYCSVTASYSFLYDILSRFRRRHSRVEIKLHTGDPALAVNRVLAGSEDIAIAARPDTIPVGLAFRELASSPLRFIAPADGSQIPALSAPMGINWARVPMILSESGLARDRVNQWFAARGLKPNIYAQVAGNEAIVSMVSLGFGVGVVPQIVLDNSPLRDRVRVLQAEPELDPFLVGLCTTHKKLRSPLVRALWEQAEAL